MQTAIEIFAALNFAVIGLSHLIQPLVWVDYFTWLRSKGKVGALVNGLHALLFGSLIVAFHNVWQGLPMLLTIFGWAQVLKGLLNTVVPSLGVRGLQYISAERAWQFRVGGALMLALSAVLCYIVFSRPPAA
ncbi:hypothetical protein AYO41_05000 [Verrucomicrobia bacterium SCGC AG-212-E04]|nr:hypothetical protein AYO41_05000 [Verrucomicrobia bacterium SCGC AG-212-E04]